MSLDRHIIIEIYPWETRVGITEDGKLVEVFWENPESKVGKIYKGIVKDVVRGLSCAFVDLGFNRSAFLYTGENERFRNRGSVFSMLKKGQTVLVQVKKEAVAEKGARVTQDISIPGRHLVLLPNQEGVSVSRRITCDSRRRDLKRLLEEAKPQGVGVIARTNSAEAPNEEILAELRELLDLWERIKRSYESTRGPGVIYEDLGIIECSLREYLDVNTKAVLINHYEEKLRLEELLQDKHPDFAFLLRYEEGDLFDKYGLEKELKHALGRRVWLRHGGYLVIDETEALTVIDVNSGKYTSNSEFEETALRTNLDAAAEIPRQLRLRRIGGIILIDFIDMKKPGHQEEVLNRLQQELSKDKAHTRVMGFTRLGILEMTRQKSRHRLRQLFTEGCRWCRSEGRLPAVGSVANEIRRKLVSMDYILANTILCQANPEVISELSNDKNSMTYIEERLGKRIVLEEEPGYDVATYKLFSR